MGYILSTSMGQLFRSASSFNGDLSRWDTSSVSSMYALFNEASSFNGDISAWDTSSVSNMGFLFAYASSFNGDTSCEDKYNSAATVCSKGEHHPPPSSLTIPSKDSTGISSYISANKET